MKFDERLVARYSAESFLELNERNSSLCFSLLCSMYACYRNSSNKTSKLSFTVTPDLDLHETCFSTTDVRDFNKSSILNVTLKRDLKMQETGFKTRQIGLQHMIRDLHLCIKICRL